MRSAIVWGVVLGISALLLVFFNMETTLNVKSKEFYLNSVKPVKSVYAGIEDDAGAYVYKYDVGGSNDLYIFWIRDENDAVNMVVSDNVTIKESEASEPMVIENITTKEYKIKRTPFMIILASLSYNESMWDEVSYEVIVPSEDYIVEIH